jgi:hypothetical protein
MSRKSRPSKSSKKPKVKDEENDSGVLPGWPGYRTREGRSGYDPIDTRTEAAHTAGTILQKLFTGRMRNPVHLVFLAVLGLVLLAPLVLAISELMSGHGLPWNAWLFVSITGLAGLVILINFIKNLIQNISR